MSKLVWWGLVCLLMSACDNETFELQHCPAVSYGSGTMYQVGSPLALGGEGLTATFSDSSVTGETLYGAHPLAIPPGGEVELQLSLGLADGGVPSIYLYGPRSITGTFGPCLAERSGKDGDPTLRFSIGPEQGGEYLVVVGRNPIGLASGDYTLTAACNGSGCDAPACPTTLDQCDVEICGNGFSRVDQVQDDGTVIQCIGCGCEQLSCGPFQRLVFDTCVCDCQVPLNPEAVCGEDGNTYATSCFAACAGVQVANTAGSCEDTCTPITECTQNCEDGFKLVDGCPVCECRTNPCQGASSINRPVCGTDGLTYTNVDVLHCNDKNGSVGVAYPGHCLPYCDMPNCDLSCEFGFKPALDEPPACFKCECQAEVDSEDGETCESGGDFSCARPRNKLLERIPPSETQVSALARVRTFVNRCVAAANDWHTLELRSCPSGICETMGDCFVARQVLVQNLEALSTAAERVAEGIQVSCSNNSSESKVSNGVCLARTPVACTTSDDCLVGQTCEDGAEGRSCRFPCDCLNTVAGLVYDPVCSPTGDGTSTMYNSCLAHCLSLPIVYPGACCDTRMTAPERKLHLKEVEAFCTGLGLGYTAQVRVDTACPPTVDDCTGSDLANQRCCRPPVVEEAP